MVEKSDHAGLWPSIYDPFRNFGHRLRDWLTPATDASGDEDGYSIAMELPGVALEDVELSIDDGVVAVQGEKRTETEDKGDTWYFSERQYGAFRRSFRLPADADGANAKASMKDGVLTISVPKLPPETAQNARKISIDRG